MKKILVILFIVIFVFTFTACDSENVKKAKDAFDDGNYSVTIECLENEDNLSSDNKDLLNKAKAHLAFEEGNYDETINLLLKTSDGKDDEFYSETVNKLISNAIETGEYEMLCNAIKADNEIGTTAKDRIIKKCNKLQYNAFVVAEGLVKNLPKDDENRIELEKYCKKNKMKKSKAFLIGKWEWQYGADTNTIVKVINYEKGLIGTVDTVGDNEKEYQILKDDVYWKDFAFIDENQFTCVNIQKNAYGIVSECSTLGTIDYENDNLKLHLTAPAPYIMVDPDRTWERVQ